MSHTPSHTHAHTRTHTHTHTAGGDFGFHFSSANDIFKQFFGDSDPFADFFPDDFGIFGRQGSSRSNGGGFFDGFGGGFGDFGGGSSFAS